MSNALISAVSIGGGGGKPMETVTLNYTAIRWDYKLQTASANLSGTNFAS